MQGGFANPPVGNQGNLVRQWIQSLGFIAGSIGWRISRNGNSEFNNVIIRNGQIISGTNLYYSGTPAAGNLIGSISAAAGTDSFGNAYIKGDATYTPSLGIASAIVDGAFAVYTGPVGGGGPWSQVNGIITANTGLLTTLEALNSGAKIALSALTNGQIDLQAPQTLIQNGTGAAATSRLLEVQGVAAVSGTDTSPSAPSPAQSLAINVTSQLTDLTRDYMLYLTFSGTGNVTVKIGTASPPTRIIWPTNPVVAGGAYPVRVPAGWNILCTGTGTVAIATQQVVGC